MINILYFISTLSYSDGVTTFVLNLIRNLDFSKFRISILCSDVRTSKDYLSELQTLGVSVYFVKSPGKDGFYLFLNDIKTFFADNHDFDIVHCNTTSSGAFVLKEAKRYNIKTRILHAHATKNAESFMKNIRNSLLKFIALRNSNQRFACSDLAGKYLFGKKSFYLIHNAIDYSKFKYNNDYRIELFNKYSLNKETKIIGFVGRFVEQKNPEFAISLMDYLGENFVLFILGVGPKEGFIKNAISNSKAKHRIFLVGEVSDTYKRYSFFDFVVMPSFYEGLPLVGVECQIAGCKLICSTNITKEVKISDNAYFVELKNVTKWIELLKNNSYNSRYIKPKKDYEIQCEIKKIEELYERFCR